MTASELIQVILMGLLVLVTGIYAWRTFSISQATEKQAEASVKMAEEMKEQRYAALKPIIDIQKAVGSALNGAREEIAAHKGELPPALPCQLRNIGPGPAIDVHSLIEDALGQPHRWDFGTIPVAIAEEEMGYTHKMRLLLQQRDDNRVLVVYKKMYMVMTSNQPARWV